MILIETKTLIKQLSDLYIIQRKKYLIQYPKQYITCQAGHASKEGKKTKPLTDWHLEQHLEAKFTIGTFGGVIKSKFITFDVDFHNKQMARWITYKIANTLSDFGLSDFYISYSGNKGYHIDLFFDDLISIDHGQKFYNFIIDEADIRQYFYDGNKVEFRPTDKQGIKLPLGKHQKSKKYCGFCLVETGLKVMTKKQSGKYLMTIKKINSYAVLDIINENKRDNIDRETFVKTEDAIAQHKPLPQYEQTEEYSASMAIDYLQNGLKGKGSRNKATCLIATYLKETGLEPYECKQIMYVWMQKQDTKTYDSTLKDCLDNIDEVIYYAFKNDYKLSSVKRDLTVSFAEIDSIIHSCPDKNQKLLAYTLLIHSKRHSNEKGVFFMTFEMMEKATGLVRKTLHTQIGKLAELEVIEIVERDRKVKGGNHKPNLYRMTLKNESENVETNQMLMYETLPLSNVLRYFYDDSQLKKLMPRRQFNQLVNVG
ncbi:TOTE conflict system archaeo-eukaryotic primase domain-containing protein [Brevibacillus ginsengisoli]|uniref:TOTE conflict system archaeo-eukaryotic primase domain-containing protein n=1 Tax=Brevibacillus ginsengisoli TaxID=363854 RepID=UPI003CEA9042